jgi:hypothetical protein
VKLIENAVRRLKEVMPLVLVEENMRMLVCTRAARAGHAWQ